MRLVFTALALLALPTIAACQSPEALGTPDPSRVEAGTYKVDSAHSQVVFNVVHKGFSEFIGQFPAPTGSMTIDPKNPQAAHVEIVFQTGMVQTIVPSIDARLKRADFFDVDKYPEAKFASTKVVVNGKTATISGNLTIKDVTKPVVLATRLVGAGSAYGKTTVGFAATTTILRRDFGVSGDFPGVSDETKLTINVAFQKQP